MRVFNKDVVFEQASSPVHQAPQPQYASRPQSVAYVAPQFAPAPQYTQAPQYVSKAALQAGPSPSYAGQHRLAAPVRTKAAAIGYSSQQPTASSPILYQAYQP